jgi:drug/metabolite transporter (DMT)-like permease
LNSALPFTLFAFATLTLTSGFVSVLNATVPLFTAIVAFVWLKDRLTTARSVGLALGVVGVTLLAWDRVAAAGALRSAAAAGPLMAIGATLLATLSYGIAANFSKRYMSDVPPIASAAGSQWGATVALLPIVPFVWPDRAISLQAWASVIALGFFCTALAYVLYFRLLSKLGPTKAVSVTFVIPVFGMLWGSLFLAETVTTKMLVACLVIALGTALSTGLLRARAAPPKADQ